jgi:response regulator RpfG family c-di-GMP phosphodiesterase
VNEKILFVDDEPEVLDGYKRTLHKEFNIDTATCGSEALNRVTAHRYAVVVSDMRMPGIDGIQLLSRIHDLSPDTVRVMLTGHADLNTAIVAVNEGAIFRFLTKPCEVELLKKVVTTCLVQHRLVMAEKELLENTLMGSIKMLTDILSIANPPAFSRALRIRRYVKHMVRARHLEPEWQFEVAAMLSQIGAVTLASEVIESAHQGEKLHDVDQKAFDQHPEFAGKLLANIPRLEGIAWIVAHQRPGIPENEQQIPPNIRCGAEILRVALAFDDLIVRGTSQARALTELSQIPALNKELVQSLASLSTETANMEFRTLRIEDLSTGMILQEEIRTTAGMLLVGRGQEITYPLAVRLVNFHRRKTIKDSVLVQCTKSDRVNVQ